MINLQEKDPDDWVRETMEIAQSANAFFEKPADYDAADIEEILQAVLSVTAHEWFTALPPNVSHMMGAVKITLVMYLAEGYTLAGAECVGTA